MQRIDSPEILDSDGCTPAEVQRALKVLDGVNRRFGGISTSQQMVTRVAEVTGRKTLSLLEVASGTGLVPVMLRKNLSARGVELRISLLDRAHSHLVKAGRDGHAQAAKVPAMVGDALQLPAANGSFDLVSCNLFAHHLAPECFCQFIREALRVSRVAVLINDLVRNPLHLALVAASYPMMRSRVAWLDGLTSVRRAYVPAEMHKMISNAVPQLRKEQVEISRHFLYRMGIIVWKNAGQSPD